jgi:hypothetical protein
VPDMMSRDASRIGPAPIVPIVTFGAFSCIGTKT